MGWVDVLCFVILASQEENEVPAGRALCYNSTLGAGLSFLCTYLLFKIMSF